MKRLLLLLTFFLAIASTSAFAEEKKISVNDFDFGDPEFLATVNMLNMEGHGTHDYASCNVKQLYYQEVAEMFIKGMTKDEILDYYVDSQGVLAINAPPNKGFNVTLWVLPFAALFLFAFFIFYFIKRWKGNAHKTQAAETIDLDETEADVYSSIIDEERKKYL